MSCCLHKNCNQRGSESSWLGKHVHVPGEWHTPNSTGTEAPVSRTLPDLTLCTSSAVQLYPLSYLLSYPFLYYKPVNISVFQSSMSHYSKLLNLRRVLWETLICSQTQQKGAEPGNLLLVIGIQREGRSCETKPLTCGI